MTKRAGKSIIASFGALSTASSETKDSDVQPERSADDRPIVRVGAGIIGATQRSLSEIRAERDRLQDLVAKGSGLELDPSLIDPSPFPDRLPDDSEEEFEAFKKSYADEGQKVPIQVRTKPTDTSRYEVVYGHRRWRASKELGLPVRAIVVNLSDDELVVAQGIENSVRQDLSWIERALFVSRMDKAGVRPRDVKAALAIDDPELARLRSATKAIPLDVIEAIGRAPKAGRPRWVGLVASISGNAKAISYIRAALSAAKVTSSDDRFRIALAAALGSTGTLERPTLELTDSAGKVRGVATFANGEVRLRVERGDSEAFAVFLRRELPAFFEKFASSEGGE